MWYMVQFVQFMNTVGVKLKTYTIKVLNMLFALRILTVGLTHATCKTYNL